MDAAVTSDGRGPLMAVVAVCRMESRATDFDPQYMRVLVERTMRFGAAPTTRTGSTTRARWSRSSTRSPDTRGRDGLWFVVAVMALVAAVVRRAAAAVVAIRVGGAASSAVRGGGDRRSPDVVRSRLRRCPVRPQHDSRPVVHRLRVATVDRYGSTSVDRWQPPRSSACALGLAAQTLLTAAFTVVPILVWAMWIRRRPTAADSRVWAYVRSACLSTFAVAPLWYREFGPWNEFRDGWWVYARQMSEGTGRDVGSQISLGWEQFRDYYQRAARAGRSRCWRG